MNMNELSVMNKPLVCPTIVGRAIELAALHTIVDEVEGGQSRVVLLSGEAGIGKSRLVTEIKTEARSRGFSVLQGNCFQRYLASPLLDLVRSSVANQPLTTRETALQPFAQEFFPVLPDLIPPPSALVALPTPWA
jgi:predicted ATPase